MGQPGNTLLNHLGVTNYWLVPNSNINYSQRLSLTLNYLLKYLYILIKIGIIWDNHLFYNFFFFKNKILLTLPVHISGDIFFKFFRLETITNWILKIRKTYLIRLSLNKIYFSSIYIFVLQQWIIFLMSSHIPYEIQQKHIRQNKTFVKTKNNYNLLSNNYNLLFSQIQYFLYYNWIKYWNYFIFNNFF